MNISRRTVLITGAARGIGQATANLLAHSGADIIGVDLRLADLQETRAQVESAGRKFAGFECDITDEQAAEAMVRQASQWQNGFDVLINNAGVLPSGPFMERDFSEWRRALEVNLIALMFLTYCAVPHLQEKEQAHIVNIASIAGKFGTEGVAAYAASKHGVVGFSSALREELRRTGIGVSWICPSPAATRLAEGVSHTFLTPVVKPMAVAKAVLRAIEKNAIEVFVPARVRWVASVMPAMLPSIARRISTYFGASRGWLEARKALPEQTESSLS